MYMYINICIFSIYSNIQSIFNRQAKYNFILFTSYHRETKEKCKKIVRNSYNNFIFAKDNNATNSL